MTQINAITGPKFTRILSVGSATPSRVIDNEYLLAHIDSSDEWITQRTGIKERRWIGEDENIETLSLTAGEQAIERAGIDRTEIGAVNALVASQLAAQNTAINAQLTAQNDAVAQQLAALSALVYAGL